MRKRPHERVNLLGKVRDGVQQGKRHVLPDDGGGLEQALVLGLQPVDARREDRLRRRRDLPRLRRLRHPIGPPLPDQHPGLHEGLHALFEEEGVALGPRDQYSLEVLECPVLAQARGVGSKPASAPLGGSASQPGSWRALLNSAACDTPRRCGGGPCCSPGRQASMMRRASASDRNRASFRHSPRNRRGAAAPAWRSCSVRACAQR